MVKTRRPEIDELLARHGIAPIAVAGTDSRIAASGGRIANVHIARRGERAIVSVSMDGVLVTSACPLDPSHARTIVRALRDRRLVPDDASFEYMFADLLVKMSQAYVDSGAQILEFETVRLHPTSYHVGRVSVGSSKPLEVRSRLARDSHDRRAIFAHRHGDSVQFPK